MESVSIPLQPRQLNFRLVDLCSLLAPSCCTASAVVTFIRSSTWVEKVMPSPRSDEPDEVLTRELVGCDEIRVRWAELGKCGNFRRVRV